MPTHSPLPQHRNDVFYRHTILPVARRIAASMIEDARASADPVMFVTGNSFMPPGRSFTEAEQVWNSHMNKWGDAFEQLWEEIRTILEREEVMSAVPDFDNAIYVVDLKRWEYDEEAADVSTEINGDWRAREEASANVFTYPDQELAAVTYLAEHAGIKPVTARSAIGKAASQGGYKGRGYSIASAASEADILRKIITIDAA